MLVFYAYLDILLYVCILYFQGICMVQMLVISAYSFPWHDQKIKPYKMLW